MSEIYLARGKDMSKKFTENKNQECKENQGIAEEKFIQNDNDILDQ